MEAETQNGAKKRPLKGALRILSVDLERVKKQFLVVLKREADALMIEAFQNTLPEESSRKLINYLKLLRDLRSDEDADLENLSDEQLEKISNKQEKTK